MFKGLRFALIIATILCLNISLNSCSERNSQNNKKEEERDPFGETQGGEFVEEGMSKIDYSRLNREQLETELKNITLPYIEFKNEKFEIAISYVISRGTELSSLAPIDFPYEIKENPLKVKTVSVVTESIAYTELLNHLCEQVGASWRVEGDTKGRIVFYVEN